ncbi:uncharacterized protein METZ01_LOCUS325923, partial [marine metagenome]
CASSRRAIRSADYFRCSTGVKFIHYTPSL